MVWTSFMDIHSGGGAKGGSYEHIFIEAPRREAELIFQNRFGHNPNRISCTCCGSDYSIDESETLEAATAYHRGCDYNEDGHIEQASSSAYARDYVTLDQYLAGNPETVLVVRASEIKPKEREGVLMAEGYVWID